MTEKWNYISEEELEQLIRKVEQDELVPAPPGLTENILRAVAVRRKNEFSAYCFRVITSVAAAIALVFLAPELPTLMQQTVLKTEFGRQEVPSREEVTDSVPSREEVVQAEKTPARDEVINDTGFIERVLNNKGGF